MLRMWGRCIATGALLGTLPGSAAAQGRTARADDPVEESYYRVVGDYFRVPAAEVAVLSDWELAPEEIPVVLLLARRAGVSADVIVALRRKRTSWMDLSRRYGVGAGAFHLDGIGEGPGGSLSRAYGEFQGRPPGEWDDIALQDAEVVGMVNAEVLSQSLGVRPAAVIAAADRTGSYVAAYGSLRSGRR